MTHIVQAGETLWAIAARYGVTMNELMRANGITNPDYVYVGQRLRIPTGGGYPYPSPGPGPIPGPGPGPFPGPGGGVNQRLERLERQNRVLEREIDRLNQRVDRLDARVRRLES